jgi:hypothetical protein
MAFLFRRFRHHLTLPWCQRKIKRLAMVLKGESALVVNSSAMHGSISQSGRALKNGLTVVRASHRTAWNAIALRAAPSYPKVMWSAPAAFLYIIRI